MPNVPAEIAIAVTTKRTELIEMLRARLARGETLPPDQIDGILDLCTEFVVMAERDLRRVHQMERILRKLTTALAGLNKVADEMREVMAGFQGDGEPPDLGE